MRIRLLTYNIHKGIGGVDRRYRLGRVVKVIGHYNPDIVLLQEVDDGVPRSRCERQVDRLAEELGYNDTAYQRNVKLRKGGYGNAILSRYRLCQQEDVELTVRPKKRRRAQVARIHLNEQGHLRSLVVVNLHLGLAGFERGIQLRRLLRSPPIAALQHRTPCVIGGDFNDVWGAIGGRLMTPAGFTSATGFQRTFPAWRPFRPLDSIYYRGDCAVRSGFAGRIELAREASDHLPLVAEMELQIQS